jgi:hypothetical protein
MASSDGSLGSAGLAVWPQIGYIAGNSAAKRGEPPPFGEGSRDSAFARLRGDDCLDYHVAGADEDVRVRSDLDVAVEDPARGRSGIRGDATRNGP